MTLAAMVDVHRFEIQLSPRNLQICRLLGRNDYHTDSNLECVKCNTPRRSRPMEESFSTGADILLESFYWNALVSGYQWKRRKKKFSKPKL